MRASEVQEMMQAYARAEAAESSLAAAQAEIERLTVPDGYATAKDKKVRKAHRDIVAYCSKCGHSHFGDDLLADGDPGCENPIVGLSIDEWRAIEKDLSLNLTDAGRAVLKES